MVFSGITPANSVIFPGLAQLEGSYLFFFLTIAVLGAFISFLLARDRPARSPPDSSRRNRPSSGCCP